MKKIFAIVAMAFTASAFAADFVSVEVSNVTNDVTKNETVAQFIRAGKTINGINYGLTSRTATPKAGGLSNSVELTAGKNLGGFTPLAGVAYDNGLNGGVGKSFTYGVVGFNTGTKVGPGYALLGLRTRVNWETTAPKQTLGFVSYGIPLNKTFTVNVSASKSYQTIKEHAYGVGLAVNF